MSWLSEKFGEVRDFATDPQVIVAVAISYASGGATYNAETAEWSFNHAAALSSAATTTALVGASRALTPPLEDLRGQGVIDLADRGSQFQFTSPASTRQIVYGRVRKSGVITNIETTDSTFVAGSGNEYLYMTIALNEGDVEAMRMFIDDYEAAVGISTSSTSFVSLTGVSNPYTNNVEYMFHSSVNNIQRKEKFALAHPSLDNVYNDDANFKGTSYITLRLKYDADLFPNGVPNFSFEFRGRKCVPLYDASLGLGTTAWTENPAVIIHDYLTDDIYGLGLMRNEIDYDSFIQAEADCDEVPTGRTTKRFTCNGVLDTSKTFKANIEDLLACCNGVLTYSGGKFGLKVAKYVAPTTSLTKDDFIGDISVTTKSNARDQFNEIKSVYFSEFHNQVVDAPTIKLNEYEFDNGEVGTIDISMPFSTNEEEVNHLNYITMNLSRKSIKVGVRCKMTAFKYEIGDTVKLSDSRYGWVDKPFEVTTWTLVNDGLTFGVDLTLSEISSDVYDYGLRIDNQKTVYKIKRSTTPVRMLELDNISVFPDWGSETTKHLVIGEPFDDLYYSIGPLPVLGGDYYHQPALKIPSGLKGKLIIRNYGRIMGVRHDAYDSATDRAGDAIYVDSQAYDPEILVINEGDILGAGGKGGEGGDGGYAIDDESNTLNGGSGGTNFGAGGLGTGYGAGLQPIGGTLPIIAETPAGADEGNTGQSDPAANAYAGDGGDSGAGGAFGEAGQDGQDGQDGSSPYGFGTGSAGTSGSLAGRAIVDASGISGGINMTVCNRGRIAGDTGDIIINS